MDTQIIDIDTPYENNNELVIYSSDDDSFDDNSSDLEENLEEDLKENLGEDLEENLEEVLEENLEEVLEENSELVNIEEEKDKLLDMTEWEELGYLNIMTIHFNKIEGKISGIFDGIDYEQIDSTNRCLEYIYDHFYWYSNRPNDDLADLVPYDMLEDGKKYHKLIINDTFVYGCELLVPIIMYLSSLDWSNLDWIIDY